MFALSILRHLDLAALDLGLDDTRRRRSSSASCSAAWRPRAACLALPRASRCGGGTSCAPTRSPDSVRHDRRQKKNANPSFHSSTFSFSLRLREYVVTPVLGAQEEAAREVIAHAAADIGGLVGALGRAHERRLRLDVHEARAEREERRQPPLRHEHVREAEVADSAVRCTCRGTARATARAASCELNEYDP